MAKLKLKVNEIDSIIYLILSITHQIQNISDFKACSFNKEGTVTAVSNADAVDYSDWLENQPLACYFKLVKIVGTYSTLLGSLQFVFSAEKISDKLYAGPVIGGVTATEVSWTVPEGEEVVEVILKFGALVDSFKVKTDKGTFSPTFGGGGGCPRGALCAAKSFRICRGRMPICLAHAPCSS